MMKNMSKADGIIRLVIAAVIVGLWYFNVVSGTALIILSVVAVIFTVTGFINFCPLYAILRLRTNKEVKE